MGLCLDTPAAVRPYSPAVPRFDRRRLDAGSLEAKLGHLGLAGREMPPIPVDPVCEAACAGTVIPVDGEEHGTVEKASNGMDMYVSGSGAAAIVLVYDIFGFAPAQTRHNCDWLASKGFMVVMPDFFRGKGRRSHDFVRPQSEDVDRELMEVVVPFVKAKGAKTLGIVGFCFGGPVAMRAAATGVFAACGGVHAGGMGSPAGEQLVGAATCPVMLLQAGGDADLAPVWKTVQKMSAIKGKSVLRTYWDQRHGWCGATGDRNGNPVLKEAVETTLVQIHGFFKRTLMPPRPRFTLHVYDHCPYCVKAQLALGWCGLKYDRSVWGYGE
eukprot:COSAG01_NODE_5636_length_4126_cov_16.030047_2_plen_326_part_00